MGHQKGRIMSNQGKILIFTGEGHGKTPAALGIALQAAAEGQTAIIIQFLKGRGLEESEFVKRLEPEIKLFRFEKEDKNYDELTKEQQQESIMNIKNGFAYARKVLSTGEASVVVLDEVLGLVDNQIVTADELRELVECKQEDTTLVMTGITLDDEVCVLADEVSKIQTLNFKKWDD